MENLIAFVLGVIIMIPVLLVIVVPVAIWRGYVLTVLWGWFVVPFFGLQQLDLIDAIGLSLIVGMFTANLKEKESKEDENKVLNYFVMSFLMPAFALLVGWILLQFR